MKLGFKIVIVLVLILFVNSYEALAQGMGMGSPCGGVFPPCAVPLDGGAGLLLIAGAVYGGKKVYDSLKKNPDK